jgi:hypothetical protein
MNYLSTNVLAQQHTTTQPSQIYTFFTLKCFADRASQYISIMKPTWCTFHSTFENQRPLPVSSITCSSSGSATQTAFGILHAYNVSWLCYGCSCHGQLTLYACNIPNAVCVTPPEDEQILLETCRGLWFSINWLKSASRWFHYTEML